MTRLSGFESMVIAFTLGGFKDSTGVYMEFAYTGDPQHGLFLMENKIGWFRGTPWLWKPPHGHMIQQTWEYGILLVNLGYLLANVPDEKLAPCMASVANLFERRAAVHGFEFWDRQIPHGHNRNLHRDIGHIWAINGSSGPLLFFWSSWFDPDVSLA